MQQPEPVKISARLRGTRAGAALLLAVLAALPRAGQAATAGGLGRTHADFCALVQRRLTGTPLPIVNALVHMDDRLGLLKSSMRDTTDCSPRHTLRIRNNHLKRGKYGLTKSP